MRRETIFEHILAERDRQARIWDHEHGWGRGDCSSKEVDPIVKATVLAEECGEVCAAVLDKDEPATRNELVQLAAVAVAWLESM